jgi:hypothetical protein
MSAQVKTYEQRRARRVPCILYLNEVSDERAVPCRATNISTTGAYVRRLEGGVFLEGERVQLELTLPGEQTPVWVGGRVVDAVEELLHDGAGVEFTALTREDQRRINGYVGRVRRRLLQAALVGLAPA